MKRSKPILKVINNIIIFGFLLNIYIPLVQAISHSMSSETETEQYISLKDFDIREYIINLVDFHVQNSTDYVLSDDVLECYRSICRGEDRIPLKKIMGAFPEILHFVLLNTYKHKAPRPDSITVYSSNAPVTCGGSCDINPILNLATFIRSQIGSVDDGSCCGSILGVLGDICDCLGPEATISGTLNELLQSLVSTISGFTEFKDTLTECCTTLEKDFQETWTQLSDLQQTITECCEDLKQDFRETWTTLSDLEQTITECCADLEEDFRETWTILGSFQENVCNKFEQTWTQLDALNTDTACCAEIDKDFQETWTILAAFEEIVCDKFEGTWTLLDDLDTEIELCCENLEEDFRETWTILDGFEENFCKKFQETWTILANIRTEQVCGNIEELFRQTWTAIQENTDITCDKFEQTWTVIDGIEQRLCEKFNATCTELNRINMLLEILDEDTIQNFIFTFSLLNELSQDILDSMTLIDALTKQVTVTLEQIEENLCGKFLQTWTILDAGFNGTTTAINEFDSILCDKFVRTWTMLENIPGEIEKGFQETWTALEGLEENQCDNFNVLTTTLIQDFNGTFSVINEIDAVLCDKFSGIFTTIDSLRSTFSQEFSQIFTALDGVIDVVCDKFVGTWTLIADIQETVTECCQDLKEDFRETWTILQKINDSLGCENLIFQSDIPLVITQPGLYCLAEDISSSATIIIDVQTDDAVIDLQMNTISGDGNNSAIQFAPSQANLNVKNGSIINASLGIDGEDNTSVLIQNIIFECNIALNFDGCSRFSIENCISYFSSEGVRIFGGNDGLIENCKFYGGPGGNTGIEMDPGLGSMSSMCIMNCIIQDVNSSGIFINGSNNTSSISIDSCIIKNCGENGFRVQETDNFLIKNCKSVGNADDGFEVDSSIGEVLSNVSIGNGGFGFNNLSGVNVKYYNNSAHDNTSGNYNNVDQSLVVMPSSKTKFYTNVTEGDFDSECACDASFQETWTAIEANTDTIMRKFQETWTILDDFNINLDVQLDPNITTTIMIIENNLCNKFEQTWTMLQEIQDRIPCDFAITQDDIPFTVSQPGTYCLAESVIIQSGDPAIRIANVDGVTIDLNGFEIIEDSGSFLETGIDIFQSSNVTIQNGIIRNTFNGFLIDESNDICLENITTVTTQNSFRIFQTDGGLIKNCKSFNTLSGINFSVCNNFAVENYIATRFGLSVSIEPLIFISGSSQICLSKGFLSNGNAEGIIVTGGSLNILIDSYCVYTNATQGFSFNNSSRVECRDCKSMSNQDNGFIIFGGASNISLTDCDSLANSSNGYNIPSGTSLLFEKSHAIDNGALGFRLEASNNTIVNSDTIANIFSGMGLLAPGMGGGATNCEIVNCVALINGSTNFSIDSNDVLVRDCSAIASMSGNGFSMIGLDGQVRNCTSTSHPSTGYVGGGLTNDIFYYNVANNNGTNYGGAVAPAPVVPTTSTLRANNVIP